ncbi:hypothetical protein KM043_015047 [Ampulex compressa]|nr:hypothetical protein KM043_015047 [Ampulex compressa]
MDAVQYTPQKPVDPQFQESTDPEINRCSAGVVRRLTTCQKNHVRSSGFRKSAIEEFGIGDRWSSGIQQDSEDTIVRKATAALRRVNPQAGTHYNGAMTAAPEGGGCFVEGKRKAAKEGADSGEKGATGHQRGSGEGGEKSVDSYRSALLLFDRRRAADGFPILSPCLVSSREQTINGRLLVGFRNLW